MSVDRLVEQARELLDENAPLKRFLTDAPGVLAGLADAVEHLQAERMERRTLVENAADEGVGICDCGLSYIDGPELGAALRARVAALEAGIVKHLNRGSTVVAYEELEALLVPSTGQETT